MLPKTHILLSLFLAIGLFSFFPSIGIFGAALIFLSGFLIDFDHYVFYVLEKRDFSLKRAYKWFLIKNTQMKKLPAEERIKHKNDLLLLHGIEPLIILSLLSIIWFPFIFILVGFSFHLILDLYDEFMVGRRIDKISICWDTIKYKKLKKLKISF